MGIFNFLKRNNKNAQVRPDIARDYYPSSVSRFSRDGTSFSCIDRIASEFAMLNYGVYNKNTKQKMNNHYFMDLISQPNLEEDGFLFFYNCVIDYFNGGTFILIRWVDDKPISFFRLSPNQVIIRRDSVTNKRIFMYNGTEYTDHDILFIPSRYDYSTLKGGTSIFSAVNSTFDTSLKLESYAQAVFNNGLQGKRLVVDISGAYPNATAEQMDELKAKMTAEYTGIENAAKPLFKKKGIEYSELGNVSSIDKSAELASNRTFQRADMSMLFGFPVELLSGTSNVDVEKAFMIMCEFSIKPIATQFQQAFNRLLDSRYYFEYDFNNLLKVSLGSRIDAYTKQLNNGILSVNEVRRKENLPEVEAGDTVFVPANNMPLTEETVEAYMAKQKLALKQAEESDDTNTDEGILNSQHSPAGDDNQ